MPRRKEPTRLEVSCLKSVGFIFGSACSKTTREIVKLSEEKAELTLLDLMRSALIHDCAKRLQKTLLEETPPQFHPHILSECLVRKRKDNFLVMGSERIGFAWQINPSISNLEERCELFWENLYWEVP